MGDHVNLERLGGHVSGSLEQARTSRDAAARVRARLAAGEGRARVRPGITPLRLRKGAALAALAVAATVLVFAFAAWRESHRALTFTVGAAGATASNAGVAGAFLAAAADAELRIAFSDGTQVSVAAGARARVAEVTPRGARLLVESGVVHASVVHRSDTHWLVDAGPFEVKVTGTRFDVAWQPGEQAIVVTLHEGSVVVTGCGLADGQRVSGGQQLHASCKTGAATLSPLAGVPANVAPANVAPANVAPANVAPGIAPPADLAPEPPSTAASSLPDAPTQPAAANASPAAAAAIPAAAIPAAPAAAVASTPSPAASSLAAATAAELLARANAERYAGHLEAAAESLDAVRRRFRGSDDAATAAFELGRIAFDGHHDFVAAGNWFDTYLRERPSGALAREALGRDIEAGHRAGDSARAEELATRYVASYPDGPHATLARRLAPRSGATP
jgi:transmembrane sensor